MTTLSETNIHKVVRTHYGQIADTFTGEEQATDVPAACCAPDNEWANCCADDLYEAETDWLPEDVTNLALGCGDPITLASLESGQTVLDLGSGGGIDCFMAARQVGTTGHVIGVDMTPAMIKKANRNKEKLAVTNVEFREGYIEDLPVATDSVDVIISNCVINLSPDKTAVFREAFRVLKAGGKLAISDMVTQGHFSEEERADAAAWAGCIAGAEDVQEYIQAMKTAGFSQISLRDKAALTVELADSISLTDGSPRLFSAVITAVKP